MAQELLTRMLRLRICHWLSLALFAAAYPRYLQAGGLEKGWEVDLKKALQSEHLGRGQSFKVQGLSFSSDGQEVAVLLEGNAAVLRVYDPLTAIRRFQSGFYDSFGWSPDSQVIHSGGHVVHLADGKSCDLPQFALFPTFMGDRGLLAIFLESPSVLPNGKIDFSPPRAAHLRFYDADCKEQDSWEIPARWLIMGASPDRGLLLVSEVDQHLIVDPFAKKVLHTAPGGRFADSGSAICAGRGCWDVDTGRRIGAARVSGEIGDVSTRSSRVVLEDQHAGRRSVWDFRSNQELVSWQLKFLTYSFSIDLDGFSRDRRPTPCAISPDGESILEGGDGKVWLYRIQP